MNRIIRTSLYCCLLIIFWATANPVNAQEDSVDRSPYCWSEWWDFNGMTSSSTIIRDDNTYRIIHSQILDNTIGIFVHTFVIHKYSSGQDFVFKTTFGATDFNDYSISITDMEIFDGFCYFCGSKIYDAVDMGGNPYSEGFVGKFSITALFSNYNYMEYNTVAKTRILRALTITIPTNKSSIALVHLVGEMDYWNNYAACIAELEQTTPYTWVSTLDYLPGTPKIYFSDIQRVASGVILAAQMACSNNYPYGSPTYDPNHQQFLLDGFSLSGCHHDHITSSPSNMALYTMDHNNDYCFHLNKAPMKLCQGYGGLYLAFGVWENNNQNSGLRVFKFSYSSPFSFDENSYYKMGGLSHEILDMVCPPYHYPILLSKGTPYNKGIISIPPFVDPSQTAVDTYFDNDMYIQSLSVPPTNNFIDISGSKSANNQLMRYRQDYTAWNENSCFEKAPKDRIEMPFLQYQVFSVTWQFKDELRPFEWDSEKAYLVEVGENNICSECENK